MSTIPHLPPDDPDVVAFIGDDWPSTPQPDNVIPIDFGDEGARGLSAPEAVGLALAGVAGAVALAWVLYDETA
jgi:hypothetical protein